MNTQPQQYFNQERFASVQSWEYEEGNNYHSLMQYIDDLVNTYSRLLVIRIDLSFKEGSRGQYDVVYASECLRDLLNKSRRNSIFGNRVGYAWGLEFGTQRGFHYHFIFFYNGHKSQQDITIGHAIGAYWRDCITDGEGNYYCTNADTSGLERAGLPNGIGMIHRDNQEQVDCMRWMATYLIKIADDSGVSLKSVLPDGLRVRTFDHGARIIKR